MINKNNLAQSVIAKIDKNNTITQQLSHRKRKKEEKEEKEEKEKKEPKK